MGVATLLNLDILESNFLLISMVGTLVLILEGELMFLNLEFIFISLFIETVGES